MPRADEKSPVLEADYVANSLDPRDSLAADGAALDLDELEESGPEPCERCNACLFVIPEPERPEPTRDRRRTIPSDSECVQCQNRFCVPEHVRAHCAGVALIATALARRARENGLDVCVQEVRAAALLHDVAKAYTIQHGGNHSQLGGAWIMDLTGNARIAQAITHHVHWPFEVDAREHFLALTVLYADKRVRHDEIVSLGERYEDLFVRYGKTEDILRKMRETMRQSQDIERALADLLEFDPDADSFDSRGLVRRA